MNIRLSTLPVVRRRRPILALIAAGMVTVAGCGGQTPRPAGAPADASQWITSTPPAKGALDSVTWNLLLEPAKLDPAESANYGESVVLSNLCESLQTLNPDFSISDGMARLTANEDRTELVYTIDPKARFWDGKPVTGEDAAYSLTRVWKPTGVPYWSSYFSAVKSIEATGEREVTLTLRHADLLLEKLMATSAGAVVEKAHSKAHPALGTPKSPPMCSGPYRFVSWKAGSSVTIERDDAYWRGVTAKTKKIVFSFLQGDATQTTALTGDAVQGMFQPPFTGLGRLKEHGNVYYGKTLLTFYLIPSKKPGPLQDVRIRKALFLALDRTAVAGTAFSGAALPARSLVPDTAYGGVTPARSEGTGGSAAELEQAKELVRQAGSPKQPIVLVAATGITESMNQTLQALVEAGKAIGLNMVFKPITLGQYYGMFGDPKGWQAVDGDGFGSQWNLPVADPLAQFHIWGAPDDASNYGGFTDQQAAELIGRARAASDAGARDRLMSQADRRLFDQLPWLPIVEVASTVYLNREVTGPPASFVNWYYPWAAHLGAAK